VDLSHVAATLPACDVGTCPAVVYQIQPLQDPRWAELVNRHPRSSAFHTVAWLEALHRTYGYEPTAYTTSPPGTCLENGLVFCRVASWITGRRIVSLPFSDHCEPLVHTAAEKDALVSALEHKLVQDNLKYVEVRGENPIAAARCVCPSAPSFCFHRLDLRPDLETLFANCHKSSTQRKILRAQREGLAYEAGRSGWFLDVFWDLLLLTRRRHGIPPQPKSWYRNLIACFGESLQIRVASKEKHPVAAILTLRHRDTLIYKYGCSDTAFNQLGGTQLLFWRSIQEAKHDGLHVFDLGRSDSDNPGLIRFKDRLGGTRSSLTYTRLSVSPISQDRPNSGVRWVRSVAKRVVPCLPDCIFRAAGSALYRHMA